MEKQECYCKNKDGALEPITNTPVNTINEDSNVPPEVIQDNSNESDKYNFMKWTNMDYLKEKAEKIKANPEKYMKQVLSHPTVQKIGQKIGQKAMANPHFREFLNKIPRPKGGKSRKTRRRPRRRPRGNPRKTRK